MEKWAENSYVLEVKPRSDGDVKALVFIDCPLVAQHSRRNELIRLTTDKLQCGPSLEDQRELDTMNVGTMEGRLHEQIRLQPETIEDLAWADSDRLFTARVGCSLAAEPLDAVQLSSAIAAADDGNKTIDRLCGSGVGYSAQCALCAADIIETGTISTCLALPCDDWQSALDSVESMFCHADHDGGDASGNGGCGGGGNKYKPQMSSFLPKPGQLRVSNSYLLVHHSSTANIHLAKSTRSLHCDFCLADLGTLTSQSSNIYQLSHSAVDLKPSCDQRPFLTIRFQRLERYLAWLFTYNCHAAESHKFLVRSFDKRPHLLVWLLDSYCHLIFGRLERAPSTELSSPPVRVLKLMYKMFDEEGARNDPRAQGQDASLCVLQLPNHTCQQAQRLLMDSTHALPPAQRTIGQFYVGLAEWASCALTSDSVWARV